MFKLLTAHDVESELLPAVEAAVPNVSRAYRCVHAAYPQARSDIVRYAALYINGGVYLDVKSAAREPLDNAFGTLDSGLAHFSEQAVSPHPHVLLTWACASPPGHPAMRTILSTMVAAILDAHADVDATGKQAVLSLTGPRLLTRALDCQVSLPNTQRSSCKIARVQLHTRDFEGKLIYDATKGCYRNSTARAQYQHATATVRSAECRAYLSN